MPRRPDLSEYDKPLTTAEVEDLRQHLLKQHPLRVQRVYQAAFERCRLHGELLPKASAIQELVTAWKALRDIKRRGPADRG